MLRLRHLVCGLIFALAWGAASAAGAFYYVGEAWRLYHGWNDDPSAGPPDPIGAARAGRMISVCLVSTGLSLLTIVVIIMWFTVLWYVRRRQRNLPAFEAVQ